MKIGIQTWGSTGDVHPLAALAGGLAGAGHEVTVAITGTERTDYGSMARRLGITIVEAGHIGEDAEQLNAIGSRIFAERDPMKQFRIMNDELFEPCVDAMYEAACGLAVENELLIGHFLCHPAQLAAERAALPYLTVTLNPSAIPSRHVAPNPFPNLGGLLNGLLWRLAGGMLDRALLPSVNRLRGDEGAPPLNDYRQAWESPVANLIAVSPQLAGRLPDWEARQHLCGFFELPDERAGWSMPEGLTEFLRAGPPPIYLTFGSMLGAPRPSAELEAGSRLLVEAVRAAGCRAVVHSHWEHVNGVAKDDAIYRIGRAPHQRIFPHCAAVLHHGGAGTTHTALRAGRPSIVVPHLLDQFYWGERLRRLGVAPPMIKRDQATVKRIAGAIRRVLDDPEMTRRAEAIAGRMAEGDGVRRAVRVIEEIVA